MGAKAPSEADRRRARDLAANGQQAAILGDSTSALNSLRQAAALDPTNADLAYQLARVYEQSKAGPSAAAEYCRFLVLAPASLEAAEVRERILTIIPPRTDPNVAAAQREFQSGTTAYNSGQFLAAQLHFSGALKGDTTWAEAYYNRALVHLALAQRVDAMNDFERYLRFKPEATDRLQIVARIDMLRAHSCHSHRPSSSDSSCRVAARFILAALCAARCCLASRRRRWATALKVKRKRRPPCRQARDPFGNRYTFTTTRSVTEHPYLAPGIVVAGGIALVSAVEAFHYAGRVNTGSERLSFYLAPGVDRFVARVEIR